MSNPRDSREADLCLKLVGQACPRPLELDGLPVSRCHLSPRFPNIDKAWAVLPLGCLHVGDPYPPPPCSSPMDGTVPPPPILPLWSLILLLVGTQESPESEAQRG